jgi:hypothetical protein
LAVILTARRALIAVLALVALAAGAYGLGRATGGGESAAAAPKPISRAQVPVVPTLRPAGAVPDLRGG